MGKKKVNERVESSISHLNKLVKNKVSKNIGRFISFDTVTKKVNILTKNGTESVNFSDIEFLNENENNSGTEDKTSVPDSFKDSVASFTSLKTVITNLLSILDNAIEICDETKITNSSPFKTFKSQINNINTQLDNELKKVQKEQKIDG